jgi:hypothetical protein
LIAALGFRVSGREANQTVPADTNGATKMTMMVNGGQAECMARAPSGGHLVNGMTENGLKAKKMGWVCSLGVMAPHMMVSGSLARSTALGYAVHLSTGAMQTCTSSADLQQASLS